MKHKIRIPILEKEVLVTSEYILKEKEFVGKELEISFYNSEGDQKEKFRDMILNKRKEFYEANKERTKPFKKD
jgi:hypothetical protein